MKISTNRVSNTNLEFVRFFGWIKLSRLLYLRFVDRELYEILYQGSSTPVLTFIKSWMHRTADHLKDWLAVNLGHEQIHVENNKRGSLSVSSNPSQFEWNLRL